MLRVTFEVVPFGDEEHPARRVIGTVELGLLGVDDYGVGSYVSRIETDGKCPDPPLHREVRLNHHRERGAYSLVRAAIKEHWRE